MKLRDYSDYSLQELYELYRTIDNEKYPEEAKLLYEQMILKEKGVRVLNTLASPWERLGAFAIDALIFILIGLFAISIWGGLNWIQFMMKYGIYYLILSFVIGQVLFVAVNGWLLYKNGQTVGKKVLGIKIVTLQNEIPPLSTSYGLRYLLNYLIIMVPLLGGFYFLVDVLFIFSKDRRCLHDLMAGTKVIPSENFN